MNPVSDSVLSNPEIAARLASLAQLLAAEKANPYKIKAYRRAAETVAALPENMNDLVRRGADLTAYPGIGPAIGGAIREIALRGTLGQLEQLRARVGPELAAVSEYPRLDPKRVLRIYRALKISTIAELREKWKSGELAKKLGARLAQHVGQALLEAREILLYDADVIAASLREYLLQPCGVVRAELTGACRRRAEVVGGISFLVETDDFPGVIDQLRRFGGRTEPSSSDASHAVFNHSSGVPLRIEAASKRNWGRALLKATGSSAHLESLARNHRSLEKRLNSKASYPTERAVYRKLGLPYIEPELREGSGEVELAAADRLPVLVSRSDLCGDLHAHTVASDGAHTIEQMADRAREMGYQYLGITDHSQSLKIAGGVSEADLRRQLRAIDKLNGRMRGFRLLKSAEVDILADGSLDYPDALLRELDYTVCSIHSRFGLNRGAQTERILRAMDNPYFTILGHATGRLLLRRPGYEIDFDRLVEHAKQRGCFFEINSSPDRLDLSAEHARSAGQAGVKIAICTDAHHMSELDWAGRGVDQARRAGLDRSAVLNARPWRELKALLKR
jgi:DNA polymerase (family 10)